MPKRWKWSVFHVPRGVSYAVGNSRWGSWLARKLGFRWIDKDVNITRDNVAVYGHWPKIRKNGYILSQALIKKYGRDVKISQVTWAELSELRTRTISFRGRRKYRFQRVFVGLIYAYSIGLKVANEYKGDPRMRHKQFWVDLHKATHTVPLKHKLVMSLPSMPGAGAVFKAAHEAGWPTMVIRANEGVPRSWEPYLTYYRGRIKWIEGK